MKHKRKRAKIAIIGGGVAGSSVALYLGELGLNVTLFEKEKSLVNGPPMCHLHAGGNLYREIDDRQCIKLLKQSIELLRFYPYAIDFRPTVIAIPKSDKGTPQELFSRLELLKDEYEKLIKKDSANRVLGESSHYYKLYSREDIEQLKEREKKNKPLHLDEWMIPVAQNLDLEKIKFPLILVQEYGLNVFRIAASATLALEREKSVDVQRGTFIKKIEKEQEQYIINGDSFDFLINAAGFRSGMIDDMLGIHKERLVEFKAAYVTQWSKDKTIWPEIVFYGERGTPKGMAQFTPYPDGYFQLHGMTKDITLFEDGLVKNSPLSAQPKLSHKFLTKIDRGWNFFAIKERTSRAIEHIAQYIPSFADATVASKPLFGAQQIPGDDASLRATEVSFEAERYARCEIVKASSILSMADAITQRLIDIGLLDASQYGKRKFENHKSLSENEISKLAKKISQEREYPKSLAEVNYGVRERI